MTIVIPVDAETEQLARKLAAVTGKPLPAVVKEEIEASAAAAGVWVDSPSRRQTRSELLARMLEITNEISRLPVLDPRSADELIGYDECGLPT